MVTGKYTDVFRGTFWFGGDSGGGVTWEYLPMEKLLMGKKLSMEGAQDFLALFKKQ